jgi:catechol 2,3-dioxygenase-like lactoylglutathione lyase family enzyme
MPDAGGSQDNDLGLSGLSHLVIQVSDVARAAAFYSDVLGLEASAASWPGSAEALALASGGGQHLVLSPAAELTDLRETGVHHAFAVSPAQREKAAAALAARDAEVFDYAEDPPDEAKDRFYFLDLDGNRIQLVTRPRAGADDAPRLDHTAVQVADILWAERFYTEVLGFTPVHRVGWNTADYARAQLWADGKEDMAPGTRRLDKRYSSIVNRRMVPRVNMQVYFACGGGVFGVYLANRHFQEPPEEAVLGVPRTAFRVTEDGLARARERLEAAGWRLEGPVAHAAGRPIAASLYLRDPGGNFIELATAAEAAP